MTVRIRPYALNDGPDVWAAVRESLDDLQPWMPWAHAGYTVAESNAWIAQQVPAFKKGTMYEFAIVTAGARYLGGCGINAIDTVNLRANIGYWVRSSATRRGVATTALCLVRDWAFHRTHLIRLEVLVSTENAASQRVAEKAGALREGVLRSRLILHGRAHDAVMFSFTRPLPLGAVS